MYWGGCGGGGVQDVRRAYWVDLIGCVGAGEPG